MQANLPDRTVLQIVLDWLDWKILGVLGLLLLALCFRRVRLALAAFIASWRKPGES